MDIIYKVLKTYWGYDRFRLEQEQIINYILSGSGDMLVIMPTGAGKSLCFQIPALVSEGVCIVISPLIALIKDQVNKLNNMGIPCLALYSGMSNAEIKNILEQVSSGSTKFLYISPERIQTDIFQIYLQSSGIRVSFIVIDEAHCISQWGHDFRPSYLKIKLLRNFFSDKKFVALTASATFKVQQDMITQLGFTNEYKIFRSNFASCNISYYSLECFNKINKLIDILKRHKGTSIVYCSTRRRCEMISSVLISNNIDSNFYHAGLSGELRNKIQDLWLINRLDNMVCTSAFGMGIDKPDVRLVVHYDIPTCLENFYQESGRAGRDGKKSYSIVLYNENDINNLKSKIYLKFPDISVIKKVYVILNNFYRIPLGKGKGSTFNFQLENIMSSLPNLKTGEILGAIDILKTFSVINIFDTTISTSKITISCSKHYFDDFKENNYNFFSLLDFIVRSLANVWHDFVPFDLNYISKKLKITKPELSDNIKMLEKLGVVKYTPEVRGVSITFLVDFVSDLLCHIDLKKLEIRKADFSDKIEVMSNFLSQKTVCKNKFISNYFGHNNPNDCGICDVCKKKMNSNKGINSKEQVTTNVKMVLGLLEVKSMFLSEILTSITHVKKEDIEDVVNFLISEGILKYDASGILYLNE